VPTVEQRFSGSQLAQARRDAGGSRELVAYQLRVSVQTVANWETGRCAPRAERLGMLATILDCSVADFFEAVNDD
jgi:transcriptional regulator with XRE-family HTH domain